MSGPRDSHPSTTLLRALALQPGANDLRERAARALEREGQPAAATRLLVERFINLVEHVDGDDACLCKGCLVPETYRITRGGSVFWRDHVIGRGRVLFYWIPEELLADKARVRRSVADSLREKLRTIKDTIVEPFDT